MRLYISVDLEGCTGLVHRDQFFSEGRDYERARRLMTGDVNAAIEGALEAGVTEVLVNDSHANMRNILLEELSPRATLITGSGAYKEMCQVEGIDGSFAGAFFVGYHAMANTPNAIHPHTIASTAIRELRINGRAVGETALNAGLVGGFGVPVLMVSGDSTLVREAREFLGEVETVAVKHPRGRMAAECLSPSVTRPMLREAARRAVESRASRQPFRFEEPIEIEVDYLTSEMAEKTEAFLSMPRRGAAGVAIEGVDLATAYKLIWRSIQLVLSAPASWM
jgi:D-amino peptidase